MSLLARFCAVEDVLFCATKLDRSFTLAHKAAFLHLFQVHVEVVGDVLQLSTCHLDHLKVLLKLPRVEELVHLVLCFTLSLLKFPVY